VQVSPGSTPCANRCCKSFSCPPSSWPCRLPSRRPAPAPARAKAAAVTSLAERVPRARPAASRTQGRPARRAMRVKADRPKAARPARRRSRPVARHGAGTHRRPSRRPGRDRSGHQGSLCRPAARYRQGSVDGHRRFGDGRSIRVESNREPAVAVIPGHREKAGRRRRASADSLSGELGFTAGPDDSIRPVLCVRLTQGWLFWLHLLHGATRGIP